MALFKDTHCVHCGNRTKMISRVKLENDQYICGKCTSKIPMVLSQELTGRSYEEFLHLDNYMKEVNPQLKSRFRETHKFYGVRLDTAHDILCLSELLPEVYVKLSDVSEFDLKYVADEVNDGWLGVKVTGKVFLRVRADDIFLFIDKVMARNVKANAKTKGLMGKKVIYDNPAGMDEFLQHYEAASQHALNELLRQINRQIDALE